MGKQNNQFSGKSQKAPLMEDTGKKWSGCNASDVRFVLQMCTKSLKTLTTISYEQ